MNDTNRLSPDTEAYLRAYHCILEQMIAGMTGAKQGDSISCNFITRMLPHHRAAIAMSENLLKYSCFQPLLRIAENIIRTQTQSIADMERVMPACCRQTDCPCALKEYQAKLDRIIQTMFCEMKNACTNDRINEDFMREMIPHHLGAVRMAQTTLRYGICSQLVPILDAIVRDQEEGIREMERLLRCSAK